MAPPETAEAFRAVGRVNVAGARFCTATLIAPDLVLTAAHCLHHPRTGRRVSPKALRFVAGVRPGGHAAFSGVLRYAIPGDYVHDGRPTPQAVSTDLALLELATPAPPTIPPIPVAQALGGARSVTVLSYARDRPYALSIERDCPVRATRSGVAALGCEAISGVSGAPALVEAEDGLRLAAVVSASGRDRKGGAVALAPVAGPLLAGLRAALGSGS
jgi:V8-like Glu-specific endopeptidase